MYLFKSVFIFLSFYYTEIFANGFENLTYDEILKTSPPGLSFETSKLDGFQPISALQKLVPHVSQVSSALAAISSPTCKRHATLVLQALYDRSTWAVQMWDSSAKSADGLLAGVDYFLGNFDECINTDNFQESENNIKGKYCLATIKLGNKESVSRMRTGYIHNETYNYSRRSNTNSTMVSQLHWAICVPSSCSEDDVKNFMETILKKVNTILPQNHFSLQLSDKSCYDKNNNYSNFLDLYDIIFIVVLVCLFLILFVATIYDYLLKWQIRKKKQQGIVENLGMVSKIIICFSLCENLKNIFKCDKNEMGLDCLHGVKTLSMIFILCGHCLLFFSAGPVTNLSFLNEATDNIFYGFVYNNQLFVDSFLFIGGFLLSRFILEEFKKQNSVNFIVLYIARYVRLTPAYALVVAFYSTLFVKMNNGPLWLSRVGLEQERCRISWWTNLLYINNYVKTDSLCMFQSWYVAVDTHMFILGSWLIYPLFWKPLLGKVLLFGITLVSISIPFVITWIKRLDPVILLYKSEIQDISTNQMFVSAYIKTHMKITPYLLGICLGYILYKFQTSSKKIKKIYVIFGWILSSLMILISMFSVSTFYNTNRYDATEAALYASLDKVAWCLGIGWIIFACATQNGGPINRILSWRVLIPMGRLTFGAYLVNGIVELHSIGVLRNPRYLSVSLIAKTVFTNTLLTFIGGLLLTLMFESPIIRLQKILLESVGRNSRKNKRDTAEC